MPKIKHLKSKLFLSCIATAVALLVWFCKLPCIYRTVLGVTCPGCGMTRAIVCALHLDFACAFQYHWMFWSVPVAYLYFLLDGHVLGSRTLDRAVLWLIAIGFAVNWLFNPTV